MLADAIRVLLDVVHRLDEIEAAYFLGGSLASSMWGEPRSTMDIDLAVVLLPGDVTRLVDALQPDYYVEEATVRSAIERGASFNAIHQETIVKVDFFVLGTRPFDLAQLERRRRTPPLGGADAGVYVSSPEDLVLRKLDWFRQGGEVSTNQWRDVIGVFEVQRGQLDFDHLRRWAHELGLTDLLDRALSEVATE